MSQHLMTQILHLSEFLIQFQVILTLVMNHVLHMDSGQTISRFNEKKNQK